MIVEVAYALPEEQFLVKVELDPGATVLQAIEKSGVVAKFAEININEIKVGVFSRACKLDRVLEPGERVEVYRPLLLDPKEKRRQRAKAKK